MFREDNTGFIDFPVPDGKVSATGSGCTLVYLIAFEAPKTKEKDVSKLGNVCMTTPGIFVSDDVISRPEVYLDTTLDELIESQSEQNDYDSMYFPNLTSEQEWKRQYSIDLISSICVGWCNNTFEYKEGEEIRMWNASFKDLTHEGKNLYYGIKKLHNSKEVRLLTFNTN
jgi:hypothetical protein